MKAVAIYHRVREDEGFTKSATKLLALVKKAQKARPGLPRVLYLDIEGHRNPKGGYDKDMLELQKEFVIGFLADFLSGFHLPLCGAKTKTQSDDIPDEIIISEGGG